MSSVKLLTIFVVLLCLTGIRIFAQDNMAPPKPLDNKVYESMVGDWTGESDMMGIKMIQNVSIHWALNHQYIIMDLKAVGKDNPKIIYGGMGVFGVDEKGNVKAWWFDDWGAGAMSSGSGTFGDNKIEVTDGNDMFKETRTFAVNGNEMTMSAKGTMTMNGQETPFNESSIYKKK
jgi:hypothetical protein